MLAQVSLQHACFCHCWNFKVENFLRDACLRRCICWTGLSSCQICLRFISLSAGCCVSSNPGVGFTSSWIYEEKRHGLRNKAKVNPTFALRCCEAVANAGIWVHGLAFGTRKYGLQEKLSLFVEDLSEAGLFYGLTEENISVLFSNITDKVLLRHIIEPADDSNFITKLSGEERDLLSV